MKRIFFIFNVLLLTGCCMESGTDALAEGFQNPPHSARPLVWWHWMNGNITEDGVRKDIEWFDRIGLGGFHVFDIAFDDQQIVPERLAYMSDEWKKPFSLAIRMADSLGMDVAVPGSPGFSSTGGPWVKPEDAMKKVVWREMDLEGGRHFVGSLPEAYTSTGKFQNYGVKSQGMYSSGPTSEEYYEDIAVVAVRLPDSYRTLEELGACVSSSGGGFTLAQLTNGDLSDNGRLPAGKDGFAWIQYEFPQPQTISSLTVVNANPRRRGHSVPAYCEDSLQVSDDGVNFRTLFGIPVSDAQRQTISFEGVTSRYFRLKHRNPKAYYHYSMLKRNPDPEYSEIAEFVIYPEVKVNYSEVKAAYGAGHDMGTYQTPETAAEDVFSKGVDITSCVKDGILDWDIPEGKWRIYRFGASLTGKKNHPATPEATGFEVDKLDREAWLGHFTSYLDMYREAAGGLLGRRGINHVLTDSYEAGHQNWTSSLNDEFRSRRGYDPLPWFPVLTGAVVSSTQESEQFLFDWRKTIDELFCENYACLDEFVRKRYGMKGCFIEAHANGRVFMADGMAMKKNSAYPMSEIWTPDVVGTPDRIPEAKADVRESSSVAHIYGQNKVAVEAFTSIGLGGNAYSFCPENLKPLADIVMAHGVNLFVIHDAAMQPLDSCKPGIGLGVYGQWFTRHETWAEQAGVWIDYLARSSFMLQQGKAVSDILWYYGEDNNITGLYSHSFPDIPAGYNFDFANSDVLLNELHVKNGKLCTKTGMEYSVLCLDPNASRLSPHVEKRIEYFKSCGVKVCGYESGEITSALASAGMTPDWMYVGTDSLNFVHRRLSDAEIYWISSPVSEYRTCQVSLRTSGLKPHLWHPVTGSMTEISYEVIDGRTVMNLQFEPDDAYFIVFRGETDDSSFTVPEVALSELKEISGCWEVEFTSPFDESKILEIDQLFSWHKSDDRWIRYFSGTASYRRQVSVPEHGGRLLLDLGNVRNIAQVYVNGTEVATLWRTPFRTDITDYVDSDVFELEVRVTNLWVNRLVGDSFLDADARKTYVSAPFYCPSDEPLPSGMTGPVRLMCYGLN